MKHVPQPPRRPPDARLDLRRRRCERVAQRPEAGRQGRSRDREAGAAGAQGRAQRGAAAAGHDQLDPAQRSGPDRRRSRPGHRSGSATLLALLAATLVPATAADHRTWEIDDKDQRTQQQLHFFKNVSLFGGLVVAAATPSASRAWPAGPARGGDARHGTRHLAALRPVGKPSWRRRNSPKLQGVTFPPTRGPRPARPVPVETTVSLPGSKSQTNRALVLAALADGQSVVRRALRSRDTLLMAAAFATAGLRRSTPPATTGP